MPKLPFRGSLIFKARLLQENTQKPMLFRQWAIHMTSYYDYIDLNLVKLLQGILTTALYWEPWQELQYI